MKLKSAAIIYGRDGFVEQGKWHQLVKRLCMVLNTDKGKYFMEFPIGFKCDGLSVPRLFQNFLPSWDEKNMDYNAAGVVHDALYGNEGFGLFTREECDDIFRGLLRQSGIGRIKAGIADKAVEWFAKKHFAKDEKSAGVVLTKGMSG